VVNSSPVCASTYELKLRRHGCDQGEPDMNEHARTENSRTKELPPQPVDTQVRSPTCHGLDREVLQLRSNHAPLHVDLIMSTGGKGCPPCVPHWRIFQSRLWLAQQQPPCAPRFRPLKSVFRDRIYVVRSGNEVTPRAHNHNLRRQMG
jgi:hypothetical protein